MSNYQHPGRRRRLFGALLAVAFVLAACGNSSSGSGDDDDGSANGGDQGESSGGEATPRGDVPGVTEDEIRFSAFGTNSNNPLGTCNLDCFLDGVNAYFAFRNSEGGVHGRELVVTTVLDDELSRNQERALEIVSANDTFAAFSATQIANGWADIAEAGIPLYTWGIHAVEMDGQESMFSSFGVRCTTCTSRSLPYAGTLVDATNVGILGYGVSQASKECAAANRDSVEMYGDETGQSVGYFNDDIAFGLPNGIAPEVTAMRNADVDFVTGCMDLNGMKTLAQEMERQGMGDVPMLHPNTYDHAFVEEAGELFQGDLVGVTFRPFEADPGDSALTDYFDWMEETGSEPTEPAMVGWIAADLAYQGLAAAGEDFTRESVIEATNEMTEYSADGLIPPIDWSRQHDAPTQEDPATNGYAQECYSFVRVDGGEFEMVGEADEPWVCWDNSDREWGEPEPTDFD